MSRNKIFYKQPKAETFDFIEYAHAKTVVKDFPKILECYKRVLKELYPHAAYSAVWSVIREIEEAKLLIELQYDYYDHVHRTKGKL